MSATPIETAETKADTTPVVVKKYANRRLYNTESSSYITLDNLATMIRDGRDFVVYDAKTGDDITRGVLTQIIVEEESKGRAMLPTAFLRQIIGFYGDSLQQLVPGYLEQAMSSFALQQEQMRTVMQRTMGNFLPPGTAGGGAAEHGDDGAGDDPVRRRSTVRRKRVNMGHRARPIRRRSLPMN